jgi:hypothetical protein
VFEENHGLLDEGVLVKISDMLISMLLDTAKFSPSLLQQRDNDRWMSEVNTC